MSRLESIKGTVKTIKNTPMSVSDLKDSEYIDDMEYLLQRLEIAQNELGKIYQLANGLNANEMIIREKAAYALEQLKMD